MTATSAPAILMPLYASPAVSATEWVRVAAHGRGALAVIRLGRASLGATGSGSRDPRDVHPEECRRGEVRGPGAGQADAGQADASRRADGAPGGGGRSWSDAWAAGIDLLGAHGVRPLAHVSLGYGTRPISEIIGEISRWTTLSIAGIFFDLAPASPYLAGPVLRGVRHARRAGLTTIVLNPGVPVDPLYRRLNATICTFEGSWLEYLEWSGDGTAPGDGHLVYGIPDRQLGAARALAAARRAGLVLLSDRTAADAGRTEPVIPW